MLHLLAAIAYFSNPRNSSATVWSTAASIPVNNQTFDHCPTQRTNSQSVGPSCQASSAPHQRHPHRGPGRNPSVASCVPEGCPWIGPHLLYRPRSRNCQLLSDPPDWLPPSSLLRSLSEGAYIQDELLLNGDAGLNKVHFDHIAHYAHPSHSLIHSDYLCEQDRLFEVCFF